MWQGFGSHFERFLGTLGDILVVWKGSGTTVEFQWIWMVSSACQNLEPGKSGGYLRYFWTLLPISRPSDSRLADHQTSRLATDRKLVTRDRRQVPYFHSLRPLTSRGRRIFLGMVPEVPHDLFLTF